MACQAVLLLKLGVQKKYGPGKFRRDVFGGLLKELTRPFQLGALVVVNELGLGRRPGVEMQRWCESGKARLKTESLSHFTTPWLYQIGVPELKHNGPSEEANATLVRCKRLFVVFVFLQEHGKIDDDLCREKRDARLA